MKKLLVLILTLTIISSCFVVRISAESTDFTWEEAKEMFLNLHNFNYTLGNISANTEAFAENYTGNRRFVMSDETYVGDQQAKMISEYRIGNQSYEINTYENFKKVLGLFLNQEYTQKYVEYITSNGEAHVSDGKMYVKMYPAKKVWAYNFLEYKNFTADENTAKMDVVYKEYYIGSLTATEPGLETKYYSIPITFEKTSEGWRISTYIFFWMNHGQVTELDDYLIANPSTGDSSPAVVGLALAALVSLAAPFVVNRRRVR